MTMSPTQTAFEHVVAFEVIRQTLVIHALPGDGPCTIANKVGAIRTALYMAALVAIRHNHVMRRFATSSTTTASPSRSPSPPSCASSSSPSTPYSVQANPGPMPSLLDNQDGGYSPSANSG